MKIILFFKKDFYLSNKKIDELKEKIITTERKMAAIIQKNEYYRTERGKELDWTIRECIIVCAQNNYLSYQTNCIEYLCYARFVY